MDKIALLLRSMAENSYWALRTQSASWGDELEIIHLSVSYGTFIVLFKFQL